MDEEVDISDTITPKSDQLNADDLILAPVTVTITKVEKTASSEQPINIHTLEYPGRPYRPNKSMRRVLSALWGPKTTAWIGRKLRLYRDPSVRWANEEVGGIRISHMSDIDGKQSIPLTVRRGSKKQQHVVSPLPTTALDSSDAITSCTSVEQLRAMWSYASEADKQKIQARVAQLKEGQQ